MRWKARQSFLGREGRLVLSDAPWDQKIRNFGLALVWLSAQTLFPAEICSRDQIEFGRVRKGQGWSQLQELVTNPASLDSLEYLRPVSALYKYSCPRTSCISPARGVSVHWMWGLQQCIACHEGGWKLSALVTSKPRHCGRNDGIDLRGGEFPQDLGRRMTKGNQ
jgi:hypothetical protein